ncbi:MAG: FecR domain-containing protein [Elusimicrobia bacterium]|nr:FecR domain-containing protein [Elusimicrobiota bacterium]
MRLFLIPAVVLFLVPSAQAQLTKIGAAGAVRGSVSAMAPGQAVGRVMESGKEVYLRDAVTTDADGRMQVLLLDETVFTIGPNSSLTLDEFVYDPAKGAGRMTARVTKGVFRFVTGKIARETPSNMRVKLPVGVIGIRGTIVAAKIFSPTKVTAILVGPGPRNNASERPGAMVVSAGGQDSSASRPGMAIDVTPAGPSAPYIAPPSLVNEVASALAPKSDEPASGSGGGSSGSGSGTASSSEGSATEESGQTTAGALGDLSNTDSIAEATQDNSNITENASQSTLGGAAIVDGLSKWDDVRTVQTGSGYYSGSGSFVCSGGACGGSWTGVVSFQMDIDFVSRTIAGGGSQILLLGAGGLNGQMTNLSSFSYDSLSGNASWLLNAGNASNSYFYGSQIELMNASGKAAAQAKVTAAFNDGSALGTGYATGNFY